MAALFLAVLLAGGHAFRYERLRHVVSSPETLI